MTQGLHPLEGSLGQLALLLGALSHLVHKHRHRLSVGLSLSPVQTPYPRLLLGVW